MRSCFRLPRDCHDAPERHRGRETGMLGAVWLQLGRRPLFRRPVALAAMVMIAFAALVAPPSRAGTADRAPASFFDIVGPEAVQQILRNYGDFVLHQEIDADDERYLFSLEFPKRANDQHYIIVLEAAPGQTWLSPPASGVPGPDLTHPATMARFEEHFWGAGPGGAARGASFTTADGRFDVRVTISENLPEGVDAPGIGAVSLTERVAAQYCSMVGCP